MAGLDPATHPAHVRSANGLGSEWSAWRPAMMLVAQDEIPSIQSISIADLSCVRGGQLLFRGLSFSVSSGEALSVEGPNGVGKTSLLRMIAGFLAPAAGAIILNAGRDIGEAEERGKQVGWLGHQDGAKPQLTAAEVLRFFAALYGGSPDIAGALSRAGLERCADLPCQYLSAGQRKRLALARLALTNRPLWLLDEPYATLDSSGRSFAAELMASHCATGGIVLAATHEPLGVPCAHLALGAP
jgi:heme exporter protein A